MTRMEQKDAVTGPNLVVSFSSVPCMWILLKSGGLDSQRSRPSWRADGGGPRMRNIQFERTGGKREVMVYSPQLRATQNCSPQTS